MLQDEQDLGHEETDFRMKNLLSWQNTLSNRQIEAGVEEKWANQGKVLGRGINLFTFPHQTNGNHVTEP